VPRPGPDATVETEEARCAVCGGAEARAVGRGPDFEYATCANEFEYAACTRCGHLYLRNRPVAAELSRIYPADYGNYEASRSASLTFRIKNRLDRRAVSRLARRAPAMRRVLDVGCADGRLLDVCRAALPGAEALHGVEISEDAARGARSRGYDVTIGTIDEVDVPLDAYDLVFLQQVVEHVYAPDRVVAKLAKSLAPRGLLVIDTPSIEGLDFRLFKRRYWGGYHIPRHFNLFSERALRSLCDAAGLEHVETRYTPQPIHWAWSFRHWLADHGAPPWTWRWLNLRNAAAMGIFTLTEVASGLLTRRMSNLRVIARRPA
jgi:2-polyprenyl-3-methyl-5-hydroxy-6-metoxy-1,4-benzoquinol methylase